MRKWVLALIIVIVIFLGISLAFFSSDRNHWSNETNQTCITQEDDICYYNNIPEGLKFKLLYENLSNYIKPNELSNYIILQDGEVKCNNTGNPATKIKYFDHQCPEGTGGCLVSRTALVCGDKYFIMDWLGGDHYGYYGPFQAQCSQDSDCPTIYCIRAPCPVNKCINNTCNLVETANLSSIYYCERSSDCDIKNVRNCCGYYPQCVNKNAEVIPVSCKEGETGVCGYPSINNCICENNFCVGQLA